MHGLNNSFQTIFNKTWHTICIICSVKKKNVIYLVSVATMLLLVISCPGCKGISEGFTSVTDAITNPSARDVYAREYKNDNEMHLKWQAAFDIAKNDSITVNLPYGEKGSFIPFSNTTYSYNINLQEGEVLIANVEKDSVAQRVFIDVFKKQGLGYTHIKSNKIAENNLQLEIESTGTYKIIVQPEIISGAGFFISLVTQPQYEFPVAGKGNVDIMSFWGMERDGGKRRHEGVDIFAKKGTPVVAAAKGTIGFTGERGIGGKQVWLRDGLFGNSLYYAHLDSIAVQAGVAVMPGDTLGFVGNTGNAKFTPPHLHFGIYKTGAVNPLPYIYKSKNISEKAFTQNYKTSLQKVKGKANLRQSPHKQSKVIGALAGNDTIIVLGQHNEWLHVKTIGGQAAFLHKSLSKPLH